MVQPPPHCWACSPGLIHQQMILSLILYMYLLTPEGKEGQREHRSTVTIFLLNDCMPRTRDCVLFCQPEFSCAWVTREWRRCPVKKLNTPSTATHCGRICLKRFCFLDAWPRPSLLSKQFSPVNIVLNDSAQRLVTLYLVFTWFERYLNKIKQVEWFYIISSNMYIHDCKVENFNWYMYLCIQRSSVYIYACMESSIHI